ncbi:uncharacterized protein LOC112082826 [Eutrema salsugineum]|uniref:uncharacterized protein LOC112082826 n=1 Tax=Eutrema salsugineum TaxID=72664 RepID=UPI000CED6D73|nr:uncharacterized protein LOC112082826 [Eutrema salsugineum]
MRAVLMWTISDFPAYGMLSGWTTHGRLSCPYCLYREIPYAHLTVHDIIAQPGRERLTKLDPDLPPGAHWFGIHSKVDRTVSDIIKSYFVEPHCNLTQLSQHTIDTWFKIFAQRYDWDEKDHSEVERLFTERVKLRLMGTVSDWKKSWKVIGDDAKPISMDPEVWKGLVQYWLILHSQEVAEKCSISRNATDSEGQKKVFPHTAGQTPFGGCREWRRIPVMREVFAKCHRKKDGAFVSEKAEQLYNEVTSKVAERETQLSPGGSSVQSGGLTTREIDQIFEEKGKVVGMGSIRDVPSASSSAPHRRGPEDDPVVLRAKIATLEESQTAYHQEVQEELLEYDSIFDIIALSIPDVANAL